MPPKYQTTALSGTNTAGGGRRSRQLGAGGGSTGRGDVVVSGRKRSTSKYSIANSRAPNAPHSPQPMMAMGSHNSTRQTGRASVVLMPMPPPPSSRAGNRPQTKKGGGASASAKAVGEESVPAYLSPPPAQPEPAAIQTLSARLASASKSRPTSSFTATMPLSGRPRSSASRLGGANGQPPPQQQGTVAAAGGAFEMTMNGTIHGPRAAPATCPTNAAYVVGGAVLNPFVTVSPNVHCGVRGVPSLVTLPESAWRPAIGPIIDGSADEEVTARYGLQQQQQPSMNTLSASGVSNYSTASVVAAVPGGGRVSPSPPKSVPGAAPHLLLGSALFSAPQQNDYMTYEGEPVLCVEDLMMPSKRGLSSKQQPAQCMLRLRELYCTTDDDVPHPSALEGLLPEAATVVHEILPELLQAEARNKELAAVRRHIDWDVTIPTEKTMPPPSVVFLDASGGPVQYLPRVHFSLNTGTMFLERDFEEDAKYYSTHGHSMSSRGPPQPAMVEKTLNAARKVGTLITQTHGTLYRIHGLVGLLRGLAEKVGLERVMEYQVQCHSEEMLLSSPYVDSELGDLIIHMNPSLLGNIKLTIVGFDCGSIDETTGEVLQGSASLHCVIKAVTQTSDTIDSSQQQQHIARLEAESQEALVSFSEERDRLRPIKRKGPDAEAEEEGPAPYMFPASNPHELRYEDCALTAREFFLSRRILLKAEELARSAAHSPAIATTAAPAPAPRADGNQQAAAAAGEEGEQEAAAASSGNVGDAATATQGEREASPFAATTAEDGEQPAADELLSTLVSAAAEPAMKPASPSGVFSLNGSQRNLDGSQRNLDGSGRLRQPGDVEDSTMVPPLPKSQTPSLTQQEELNGRVAISYSSWLLMGSIQSPLTHLRLSAWTGKITALFRDEDSELHSAETREAVKRQARSELSDSVIASLTPNSPESPTNAGGMPDTSLTAVSLKNLKMLRRLILCLLLEPDRGSRQLFFDTVELCRHLCSSALLRTVSSTGGTKESLQAAAAAVLSPSPLSPSRAAPQRSISDKERANLELLADALEVAMAGMMYIGCFLSAVEYAAQRIHVMCLLENDATVAVYNAQKDLAEMLSFYGDNEASRRVSEDVLTLAEQLFDINSPEHIEAEILLTLTSLTTGDVERACELAAKLLDRESAEQKEQLQLPPLIRAKLQLVAGVVYSRTDSNYGELADALHTNVATIVGEAVDILSNKAEVVGTDPTAVSMNHRLRWNLLSLAGALLISNGEHERGVSVLESITEELALGKHQRVEQFHRVRLTAMLWVALALWKYYVRPSEAAENRLLLKRMVRNLTKLCGPFHPYAACANMLYAHLIQSVPNSHALSLSYRSYAALQRCVSPRSNYLVLAHEVCSGINTLAQRWKAALEHANAAMVITQVNNYDHEGRAQTEQLFLGCLLRCPQSAVVKLRPSVFIGQLQGRINAMEELYGSHSAILIRPLVNIADALYLLGRYEEALSCLQRALRLGDPKGILFVAHAILKPSSMLCAVDVERRNNSVNSVIPSLERALVLVEVLYTMGAVLEAKGCVDEAQDAYSRSLALLESYGLSGCLSAIRIYKTLAKLLYTSGNYGDAFSWARRAERSVHHNYPEWAHEHLAARTVVATVETRLLEKEGTYVVVNSHNPHEQFVELI